MRDRCAKQILNFAFRCFSDGKSEIHGILVFLARGSKGSWISLDSNDLDLFGGPRLGTLFAYKQDPQTGSSNRVLKQGPPNRSKSLKSKENHGNTGSLATPCQKAAAP